MNRTGFIFMNAYQEKLTEELKFLIDYCDRHGLNYFVIGGTLLGAVRHKGFIPWDNDIDFGLPRPDYERFIEMFSKEDGRYRVETSYSDAPEFLYKFSKLYDTTTTVIEDTQKPCKRGIFIDIIPLDGIGNTWLSAKLHFLPIYVLNTFLTANVISERWDRPNWLNRVIRFVGYIPAKFVNTKKLLAKLDRMCKKRDFYSSKYGGVLNGGYGLRDIVETKLFTEKAEYDFEYLKVKSVEDYDAYLTHLYGDWRKPPEGDRKKSDHEFAFVDLNKSYLED